MFYLTMSDARLQRVVKNKNYIYSSHLFIYVELIALACPTKWMNLMLDNEMETSEKIENFQSET